MVSKLFPFFIYRIAYVLGKIPFLHPIKKTNTTKTEKIVFFLFFFSVHPPAFYSFYPSLICRCLPLNKSKYIYLCRM